LRQAVILAGGKGTRLRARLNGKPKPLVNLLGKPLLEWQINELKAYGFKNILVLVDFEGEQIANFCAQPKFNDLKIKILFDGPLKGTAGAVLNAYEYLQEFFLVCYADTLFSIDLDRFFSFHQSFDDISATLFLHPNDHPHDSDLVRLNDNGYITDFCPYPHAGGQYFPNLVNAALYLVNKVDLKPWIGNSSGTIDFAKHLFPKMIAQGANLAGYKTFEYIKDCGTPERLDQVANHIQLGKVKNCKLSRPQKAIFYDRDGTLNELNGHIKNTEEFRVLPGTATAIKNMQDAQFRNFVITNQPVIARGEASFEDLAGIHDKLETELGKEGAFLDEIVYCPHHPDSGFDGEVTALKKKCDCRKPNTGMVDKLTNKYNVDISQSWLIGDTTIDVQTAANAGIKSILLETGEAGLDAKFPISPDFSLANLEVATNFILGDFQEQIDILKAYFFDTQPGQTFFLCGMARSGKSNSASLLKYALSQCGFTAHIVCVDGWIKPEHARSDGLLGRIETEALTSFISYFLNNRGKTRSIMVPHYCRSRKEVSASLPLDVGPNDIVIFEGVALSVVPAAVLRGKRFVVDVDPNIRQARFIRHYNKRKLTEDEALWLHSARVNEEQKFIDQFLQISELFPLGGTNQCC
jgi:histidinol-phosphate phosphatase family protein